MCKVISVSGSHGVGKTSLISLINNNLAIFPKGFKVFGEFNSGLFSMGFALNGDAYDFDEVMFSQSKAFNLSYETIKYYINRLDDDRVVVTDRSFFDTYIYTSYFLNKKPDYLEKYSDLLKDMEHKIQELLSKTFHILLPPFEDFEELDDRMDIFDRDNIWHSFQSNISKHGMPNFCILKSNNTKDRYQEFLSIVKSS